MTTEGGTTTTEGSLMTSEGGIMTSDGGTMTLEGGSMTSEGGIMTFTSEGGTVISEGGTFLRFSLFIRMVYFDQGILIWMLENICSCTCKSFQNSAEGGGGLLQSAGASAPEAP